MNAGVERKFALRIVPLTQQTLALHGLEQRQLVDGSIEIFDDAFQQRQVLAGHAADSSGLKQIDVVTQAAVNVLAYFFEIESEVKWRRRHFKSERADLDVGQLEPCVCRRVL